LIPTLLDFEDGVAYIDFIVAKTVKDEIIEQVERLDSPQQKKVLEFARQLAIPAGTPGRSLMGFVGCIDPEDLDVMSHAIQEGCEKIDQNAW